MLADFFTKPLQGNHFKHLRDIALGYKHVSSLQVPMDNPTAQERVSSENRQSNHRIQRNPERAIQQIQQTT